MCGFSADYQADSPIDPGNFQTGFVFQVTRGGSALSANTGPHRGKGDADSGQGLYKQNRTYPEMGYTNY